MTPDKLYPALEFIPVPKARAVLQNYPVKRIVDGHFPDPLQNFSQKNRHIQRQRNLCPAHPHIPRHQFVSDSGPIFLHKPIQ